MRLGAETEIGQCKGYTPNKYNIKHCLVSFLLGCLNEICAKFGHLIYGVTINAVTFCHCKASHLQTTRREREITNHKTDKYDLLGCGIENKSKDRRFENSRVGDFWITL